jgi:conjugal transfer/entry exclusion protein
MNFKIAKLEFYNLEGGIVLSYDLSKEISVKSTDINLLIDTLNDFQGTTIKATLVSKLYLSFQPENSTEINLRLEKNHQTNSANIYENETLFSGTLYEYFKQKLNITINKTLWQQRFLDLRNTSESIEVLIKNLDQKLLESQEIFKKKSDLEKEIENAKATSSQPSGSKRMNEINSRIEKIEKEVSSYQNEKQNRDDLEGNIKKAESELGNLQQTVQSVDDLLVSKTRIESDLKKFTDVVKEPDLNNKIKTLKKNRLERLINFLVNFRYKSSANFQSADSDSATSTVLVYGKEIIVLQVVQLILTIVLFIVTRQLGVVIAGAASMFFLVVFLIVINMLKSKREVTSMIPTEESAQKEAAPAPNDPVENALFINAAWIQALELELQKVNTMISQRFGDMSYDQVTSKINEIKTNIQKWNSDLQTMNANSLSSEEYYKKRRELDILKIEKENLELKGEGGPAEITQTQDANLNELQTQMTSVQKDFDLINSFIASIPVFIITNKPLPDLKPKDRQAIVVNVLG